MRCASDRESARRAVCSEQAVRIRGLSYRFRGSTLGTLHDIDLALEPGECAVIAGPSGCGKSTLALAMGGFLFHQFEGEAAGTVQVAGLDARQSPVYELAERVGLVQQNPETQFCTLTVGDEVAFGPENRCLPPAEIRKRVHGALGLVGAGHLVERPLATLSGGEKQRVAIAALLAAQPQVLILDEPTSSLDPMASAEVLRIISRLRENADLTALIIEHKLGYLLPWATRLVRMAEGRIVADGPPRPGDRPAPYPCCRRAPGPALGEPLALAQNLQTSYGGAPILKGLSLTVRAGELVALMGDNGSGKSTLLLSLLGLLKPAAGQAVVLGRNTQSSRVSALARQVGLIFQNPDHQLFAESVWREAVFAAQNLRLPMGPARARAKELLAYCGLDGRYEDPPYRLSYGQKRRLNLVSILTHGPRLLLLDEVLIGQDPQNAAFIMGLLRRHVEQGGAVLMAVHDPEIVRAYADRLIFLNAGSVLVDAPVAEGFRQLAALGREAYLPAKGER